MFVNFYTSVDDHRKVNKTLTPVNSADVVLKNDTSMLNPTIILKKESYDFNANYFYVGEFGRFYFVNDVKALTGQMVAVSGEIDVLMSFSSAINNLSTMIDRQENLTNGYIVDRELPVRVDKSVTINKFSGKFSDTNYNYLTVGGGANGSV